MKKLVGILTALILSFAVVTPSFAKAKAKIPHSPGILRCAVWIVPAAGCSPAETIVGGTLLTAGIGIGGGAIVGATAGYTAAQILWMGGGIGGGVGLLGSSVVAR